MNTLIVLALAAAIAGTIAYRNGKRHGSRQAFHAGRTRKQHPRR